MPKKQKKKKVKFGFIGPPVSKDMLLQQLQKQRHLKLVRSGGKKLH